MSITLHKYWMEKHTDVLISNDPGHTCGFTYSLFMGEERVLICFFLLDLIYFTVSMVKFVLGSVRELEIIPLTRVKKDNDCVKFNKTVIQGVHVCYVVLIFWGTPSNPSLFEVCFRGRVFTERIPENAATGLQLMTITLLG